MNSLLEAASVANNAGMATTAVDTLLRHKSVPRSRSGRQYMKLLAETSPPWGYNCVEASKRLQGLWARTMPPSVGNRICLIDALSRAGCSTDFILAEARSLVTSRYGNALCNDPSSGSLKILKATIRILCHKDGAHIMHSKLVEVLKISKELLPYLNNEKRDQLVSVAIAALKHPRPEWAIKQGGNVACHDIITSMEKEARITRMMVDF